MDSADILALMMRGSISASIAICVVMMLRKPARTAFGAHVSYASWLLVPAAVIASFIPRRIVLPAPTVPRQVAQTIRAPDLASLARAASS